MTSRNDYIYYFALMYNQLSNKTKQIAFFLIKLTIVGSACYFIYNKLFHNQHVDYESFINQLENSVFNDFTTILLLIGFSLTNWFLEIIKWKTLAFTVKKITFFEAFQQSLGSLTASLFTPNRIGEYGAKAIYFKKGNRRKIMLLNLLSNMAQMTVTVILGIIGLIIFINHFKIEIDLYRFRKVGYILAVLLVFIITGSVKGYKKIRGFYIDRIIEYIKNMPMKVHICNSGLSLFRYVVFSHQFYFLLLIFGVETDYFTAMSLITSMYLLASIIPGLALLDWVIKGSVALWIFSFIGVNELVIVTIVLLMWALNFGIPALLGSYFVLNFKLADQK